MLAKLRVSCNGASWTVRVDSCTWCYSHESRGNEILTASLAGPETAMKSIRALLVDPQSKPDFYLESTGEDDYGKSLVKPKRDRCSVGYVTKMAKLDRGAYHLVAVTKLSGIILDITEDRLWEILTGAQFTTPLLRGWMPAIVEQLKCHRLLEVSQGFNGSVGILDLETETLDKLVSGLVKVGQLKLIA